jgi:urease accessory protein
VSTTVNADNTASLPHTARSLSSVEHEYGREQASLNALRIGSFRGVSRVIACKNTTPLKILNPANVNGTCQAYLSTYGGGVLQGDTVSLKIDCEASSRLFLGTQSATKIYRSPSGRISSQIIEGELGSDAFAAVVPDVLIPFKDSRFSQRQEWRLHPTAALVLVDWFNSGRTACAEDFDFALFESKIQIVHGSKKIILDRMRLEPAKGRMTSLGSFGPYRNCVTAYIVGARCLPLVEEMRRAYFPFQPSNLPAMWPVMNRVNDTCYVFRAMTSSGSAARSVVDTICRLLNDSALLGFNPASRKF